MNFSDFAYAQQDGQPKSRSSSESKNESAALSLIYKNVVDIVKRPATDEYGEATEQNFFRLKLPPTGQNAAVYWKEKISQALLTAGDDAKTWNTIRKFLEDAFNSFGSDMLIAVSQNGNETSAGLNRLNLFSAINAVEFDIQRSVGGLNRPADFGVFSVSKGSASAEWAQAGNGTWQMGGATSVQVEISQPSKSTRPIDITAAEKKPVVFADDLTSVNSTTETKKTLASTSAFSELEEQAARLSAFAKKPSDMPQKGASLEIAFTILDSFFDYDLRQIKSKFAKESGMSKAELTECCRKIINYALEATANSAEDRLDLLQSLALFCDDASSSYKTLVDGQWVKTSDKFSKEIRAGAQYAVSYVLFDYGKYSAIEAYHELAKKGADPTVLSEMETVFPGVSKMDPSDATKWLENRRLQLPFLINLLSNAESLEGMPKAADAAVNGLSGITWSKERRDGILAADAISSLDVSNLHKSAIASSVLSRARNNYLPIETRAACLYYGAYNSNIAGAFDGAMKEDARNIKKVAESDFDFMLAMLVSASGVERSTYGIDQTINPINEEVFGLYLNKIKSYTSAHKSDSSFNEPVKIGGKPKYIIEQTSQNGQVEQVPVSACLSAMQLIKTLNDNFTQRIRDSPIWDKMNETYLELEKVHLNH